MSNNAQKTPLSTSLNKIANKKVTDALQLVGKALPCSVTGVSGAIITVKFEVMSDFTLPEVTIPLFGPEYIRYPIQLGDLGIVFATDARLGGVSGLGGGVADLSQPANLTALVFFPIGNKTWGSVDPNSVTIYGPNGVVLRDTGSASVITLTPNGVVITGPNVISMACPGASIVIAPGTVDITGVLTINGVPFMAHEHKNVSTGINNTGGVV